MKKMNKKGFTLIEMLAVIAIIAVLVAIIVPGPCRILGLWGRREDFVIPWKCIRRIGPDIILVDIKPDDCRVPRFKTGLPFYGK